MIVYDCKQCGQFTIAGYVNEFNEHFCSIDCYENFCEKNNCAVDLDKLKLVKPYIN